MDRYESRYSRVLDEDIIIEKVLYRETRGHVEGVRFTYEPFMEFLIALELFRRERGRGRASARRCIAGLKRRASSFANASGVCVFLLLFFRLEEGQAFWDEVAQGSGVRWSMVLCEALAQMPESKVAGPELRALDWVLSAGNEEATARALRMYSSAPFSHVADADSARAIGDCLRQRRDSIRAGAVIALNAIRKRECLPHLLRACYDRNHEVQQRALEALLETDRAEGLHMLCRDLEVGNAGRLVRLWGALAVAPARSVSALLSSALRNTNKLARCVAIEHASRLEGGAGEGLLREALRDADPSIQVKAAYALAEIGGEDSLPYLRNLPGATSARLAKAVQSAQQRISARTTLAERPQAQR